MDRTRKYNIVLGVLVVLVLTAFVYLDKKPEQEEVIFENISIEEGTFTRAKLTNKTLPTKELDISDIKNITLDKDTEVIWNNTEPTSRVILLLKDEKPVFERTVKGYSEISWSFRSEGEYRYFIDDVNNSGRITVN